MIDRVAEFLNVLSAEQGAADNTVAAYKNDLSQFQEYLATIKINSAAMYWRRVNEDVLVSYVRELKRRGYAAASVARKVAAIKSFFQYLQEKGVIKRSPTKNLESPRVSRTLPKPLTVKQIAKLLKQPAKRKTPEALRDQAMLELLYATGLRVTELVSLDLKNISLDPDGARARCMGEGAKERTVPIHEKALNALQGYLENGRPKLVKDRFEPALFVNRQGSRLTRQGFWLILKQYAKDAGILVPVTPHSLRHSFATHMLRGGAPVREVQEMLGHKSFWTTKFYERATNEETRRIYDSAHPRAQVAT